MNAKQEQRLKILVILLAALVLTIVFVYQMNRPQTASAIERPQKKTSANPPAPNDARIRLDLVQKDSQAEDVGEKNLFQYRIGRPAPVAIVPGPVIITEQPRPLSPSAPPPPPPPPPIPLKYQGYAQTHMGLTAFVTDDQQRRFNVVAGEVLMGRYRIVGVTETTVSVEDLEYNRRQTLPLVK